MLYLHLCNKPRFIYVEKHSKRVSQLPLCVLIIKCLFRLLPKTTHVCNKKREICMLEEKRCICITLKVNLSINPSMVGFYHPLFSFFLILILLLAIDPIESSACLCVVYQWLSILFNDDDSDNQDISMINEYLQQI